ncbi:MAG: SpoIIE family protein phosphatase [Candidatus Omnitrophica bacterium]|nr:SpoIIE family protein phosphatase [Candidatus Omnitrophota bacterium]MDD5654166.1 SpoIIE family protein phosphatase [Candidatus Omnitrophota bacterium]
MAMWIAWGIGLFSFILSFTNFFIGEISKISLGTFEGKFEIGFYLWGIYMTVFTGYSIVLLIKTYLRSAGLKKLQIKYVGIGFALTGIFVIILDVVLPFMGGNKKWMALDSTASIFYLAFTAYAIVRYRAMEIDTVLHKTILWLLTSLWLLLPAYFVFAFVRPWLRDLNTLSLTVFAAAFFYIFLWYYRYFQPKIDHFFRRRKYDYQTVLGKIAEKIATTIDIEDLTRKFLTEICETMYLRTSLLYIISKDESKYFIIGRRGYKEAGGIRQRAELEIYTTKERDELAKSQREFNNDNPLFKWLAEHQGILERERIEFDPQYAQIKDGAIDWLGKQELELIVPLTFEGKVHAILGLGKRENLQAYTVKDLELLKKLGQEAGATIFNALHYEDSLEKERLEEEMRMGHQIQTSLLPQFMPQVFGLSVQGLMQPAKEIGGDYYDFIPVPNKDDIAIVIGDVSGKGVGAGLIMSMTKATIHTLSHEGFSPKEILLRANEFLNQHVGEQKFMTLLYLLWKSRERMMAYSSAGHEHILICRAAARGQVEAIVSGGFMLGMLPDIGGYLEEKQIKLEPGDKILLYTDGVTEAENQSRDRFGLERLKDAFLRYSSKPADELMHCVKDEVYAFIGGHPQYDDITLVVLEAK